MVSTTIFGRKTSYARCVIVFLYLFLLPHKTYSQPCSSSCGKISNINHPFRLKHDPDHCGNNLYELNCVNNVTVLKLFDAEYFVQSINYNNYTIRVVDPNIQPNNCSSLPRFFLYRTNFTYYTNSYEYSLLRSSSYDGIDLSSTSYVFDGIDLSRPVIYMNCTSPPSNNVNMYYTDTSSCMGQHNIYAIVGDPQLGILEPQCRVKLVTLTSFWVPPPVFSINNIIGNVSYIDIHKALGYGFEISWILAFCPCDHCYLKDPAGDILCYDPKPNCTNCSRWWMHLAFILYGLCELASIKFDWEYNYNYANKVGIVTGKYVLPYIAVRIMLGIILFSALLIYTYRRRHASIYENIEDFLQSNTLMPIRYSYKEIKQMTKGLKVKLGEGGYGDVYRGNLISGPFVAIKMLKIKSKTNGQDFISEVATIGRIYHSNVVRLVGFCVEGSKRALVYEYMPNGSLDKYIFNKEGVISLSNDQIYEISLGVARGISYLHQGCDMQILHFDIKPHNILLDENFIPKVSDFGLAKLYPIDKSIATLTAARGTIGYMAPELFYQNIGRISHKADVYSFGMLLIEIASRRRNLNSHAEHSSQLYFPFWIYDQLVKSTVREMEDVIMEEINDVLKKIFIVALWCIQLKPVDRPSMNKVVEMLEGDIENIEMPPKPLLYPHETNQDNLDSNSNETESDWSTSYVEEIVTNPLLK
ncbi:LEAF RUST 10 DISEASE-RESISTANCEUS RECEPTOR-LIKE PROTEIN KINASE-like 2.2 isoform X2 [Medicago truncatula]|uniref:LEAF RUST 10 DISEASE-RESISTANCEUS RECEPTOR-LIKE PROTEIN KINASE-like 2.2 isoform X2 n=1 Tax=Medicago truncatula TaxID=3880 RepID=UPI0019687E69|nr:LEAF RUST 10 DISEASE-RESISTANCE LOCUS RECEPTOR-LIKE PROTEIN KINASE-like 2.2 isoform X2 [Medicago truncatula]